MENNFNYNVNNYDQAPHSYKKTFSKFQFSMLSRALLVASVGLALTCGIGYLLAYIYTTTNFLSLSYGYSALTSLSTIFLLLSVILSFVWMAKIHTASNFLSYFTILIFCISNGIGFSSLFYLLDVQELVMIFGTAAIIFFGTWFLTSIASIKFMMSLGKILIVSTIVYLLFNFMMFMFSWFNIFGIRTASFEWIYIITTAVSGLLSIGYLAFSIFNIQKMDEFLAHEDNTIRNKYAMFFGFTILMNMISIIWTLARLFLIFGRN